MKKYIPLVLVALIAYFAYDLYSFFNDSASPLIVSQAQVVQLKTSIQSKEKKVAEAKLFYATLETKRAQLRQLSEQLRTMKATLSENLDVPSFMKLIFSEAKRIGLNITALSPLPQAKSLYYVEQPFTLAFTGVYVQLIAFIDRLSQAQRIVRVDDFKFAPKNEGARTAKYVDLDGSLIVKTYFYLGTKEDDLGGSNPAVKK